MGRKTARPLLIAGILIIGFGILAYTIYVNRMETKHDKAAESLQPAHLDDNQAAHSDENQTATILSAAETKEKIKNGQVTAKADEKSDLPSKGEEGNLLEAAREALDNPDVAVRVQIVRKLRKEKSEEAVALLYTFLNDDSKLVISSALNSLAYIGKDGPLEDKVYGILLEKAKDKDFYERGQSLIIASMFNNDDRTLPVISDFISEDDENEIGKRYAVKALAVISKPECVDFLKKILDETKDPEIQKNALHTISRIESDEAMYTLAEKLNAPDTQLQLDTAWALSQQNNQACNQILSEALMNRKLNEETIAIISQNPAGPVLLEEVLASSDFNKKEKLSILEIYASSMVRTPNSIRSGIMTTVQPLLEDQDPDLQVQAIRILGMGFGDETTQDILKPKLQSSEVLVRKEALDAYQPYLSPDNYKPVLDLIWDKDEDIRRKAFMLATQYTDESDRQLLEKALNHDDEVIREQAQQQLLN